MTSRKEEVIQSSLAIGILHPDPDETENASKDAQDQSEKYALCKTVQKKMWIKRGPWDKKVDPSPGFN